MATYRIVGGQGGTQLLPETYGKLIQRWQLEGNQLLRTSGVDDSMSSTREISSVRPTVDILVKSGSIAYVMAGLQVKRGIEETISLLAQQWIPFEYAINPAFRLVLFQGEANGEDERLFLAGHQEVQAQLEQLMAATSSADLSTGFHAVSLVISNDWIPVSPDAKILTCVGTVEQDPREVFTLSDDLLEMTATTLLSLPLPR